MSEFNINPKIERAINNLKVAKLEPLDDCGSFIINKLPENTLLVGKYYKIKLDHSITNPSSNSTLHINWNNNQIPQYAYMTCEVIHRVGNMIKLHGSAYDSETSSPINYFWQGWVPEDKINILEELD